MQNYATQKQRDEIKRLGDIAFKGDIESEAFLEFSPWLQQKHGLCYLKDIDFHIAQAVIKDLRELAGVTNHPQHGISIAKAAQMYLRGIAQGQAHPTGKAPAIEVVIANIEKEMSE